MKRTEIPNPQFYRKNIEFLNGTWDFFVEKDGIEQSYEIEVPFCPESALSGLSMTGFIKSCRYERKFTVSKLQEDERLVLHFGAVDYEARIYVNGVFVGKHRGGYTPFSMDISAFVHTGENALEVRVFDDIQANLPSGKQCRHEFSQGCFYTRTTGIWQPVWLERTPKKYIRYIKYFPHIDNASVDMELGISDEGSVSISVSYQGKEVGYAQAELVCKGTLRVSLAELHLWELGKGELYDVTVRYGDDEVFSYFGMREVCFDGMRFMLNGKTVFQRLVLDQGMFPDGVYTAPNDEAMANDIRLGMKLGFNGARLHQKVFEPRMLYHCDRMGYMVWGEFPSWGVHYDNLDSVGDFVGEWTATIERDFNHPCIVLWCPLNETWEELQDKRKVRDVRFVELVYETTKAVDSTRPCVDVSGGYHGRKTDLFDFHDYHDSESLKAHMKALAEEDKLVMDRTYAKGEDIFYEKGVPTHASEYGGVSYATHGQGWGYRSAQNEEGFIDEYIASTKALLDCPKLCGFCYTQLYDIEQEQNGLFTYARENKFSEEGMQKIAECNKSIAMIEKEAGA